MKPLKFKGCDVSYDFAGDLYITELQDAIWALNHEQVKLFKDHKRYVIYTECNELIFGATHGLQMFKAPKVILKPWRQIRRIK